MTTDAASLGLFYVLDFAINDPPGFAKLRQSSLMMEPFFAHLDAFLQGEINLAKLVSNIRGLMAPAEDELRASFLAKVKSKHEPIKARLAREPRLFFAMDSLLRDPRLKDAALAAGGEEVLAVVSFASRYVSEENPSGDTLTKEETPSDDSTTTEEPVLKKRTWGGRDLDKPAKRSRWSKLPVWRIEQEQDDTGGHFTRGMDSSLPNQDRMRIQAFSIERHEQATARDWVTCGVEPKNTLGTVDYVRVLLHRLSEEEKRKVCGLEIFSSPIGRAIGTLWLKDAISSTGNYRGPLGCKTRPLFFTATNKHLSTEARMEYRRFDSFANEHLF